MKIKKRITDRLTKINDWSLDHSEAIMTFGIGLAIGAGAGLYSVIKTEHDRDLNTVDAFMKKDGMSGLLLMTNNRGDVDRIELVKIGTEEK